MISLPATLILSNGVGTGGTGQEARLHPLPPLLFLRGDDSGGFDLTVAPFGGGLRIYTPLA